MASAPNYSCSTCGLSVVVLPDGSVIRACPHGGSIVGEMRSQLFGLGGVRT